jgi:tRNA threonylcarbamoyladenosine biosynthesis protein TsaE
MIETGRFRTSSPEETEALGRRVGEGIDAPTVLLLAGDLGAGKTLFTRGLAAGLGIDADEVSSPTFALVNRYEGGRLPLYHLDLYRLDRGAAIYDLGLEEILDERAVVAVEWPDRLVGFPVPRVYLVEIEYAGDEAREITIEPWEP